MLIETVAKNVETPGTQTTPARSSPGTGSLVTTVFEGEGDEAVRSGAAFFLQCAAVTGIAPVQAIPTTAAQWLLYNPASNDKTIWIDVLGMWLASGTAGAGGTVLFGMCGAASLPATRPTVSNAGITLAPGNPRSSSASGLVVASAQTLQASPGWAPLAFMDPAGTILGQTQMDQREVRGRIGLQPDTGVALAVISPTGTNPLWVPYGAYREYRSSMT